MEAEADREEPQRQAKAEEAQDLHSGRRPRSTSISLILSMSSLEREERQELRE